LAACYTDGIDLLVEWLMRFFSRAVRHCLMKSPINFCKAIKAGKKGDEAFAALLAGRTWDELEEDIKRGWSSRGAKFEFQ
jgi:hypothetical protein